jgi:CRISP-associated protein Cas1
MIKRTLYFGNPAYLNLSNGQLVVRLPEVEKNSSLPLSFKKEATATIPIEDIGVLVLDHKQITLTHGLLEMLMQNNCAVLTCDSQHLPTGLLLPLNGNSVQTERFRDQIEASEPLKKQLWAQTVAQKIRNQSTVLNIYNLPNGFMVPLYKNVKSGDTDNCEATAAAYYWKTLFANIDGFKRYREGPPPNHYLNYGYAILRGVMARSLVGAGLLPTLGIFHHNRYNAFCLADDIMEPYRPYVDRLVKTIVDNKGTEEDIPKEVKTMLLGIPVIDVTLNGETSPLMVATQRTAVSLVKCFAGEQRKLVYPEL